MANTSYTVKLPNSGTYSGQVLTTNGFNGTSAYTTSWANPSTHISNSNGDAVMTIPHGADKVIIEQRAALEVKGKMTLNGLDLDERLKTIERVLAIPERDATMEAKYPSLKKKFDEYINSLEKYRTWERLKGTEND